MSGEGSVIEREIFIDAPPETVFGFLIEPVLMAQWIGRFHRLDPRPGGIFQVEVSRGNVARGVYTEVTPFRRVAFTWGWDSQDPTLATLPPGVSLVEFELEAKDGGTRLLLRHSRLPTAASTIHAERWSLYLRRLETVMRRRGRSDERRNFRVRRSAIKSR
jgi:uncharacterized protein YndB with AHSA1/START domain